MYLRLYRYIWLVRLLGWKVSGRMVIGGSGVEALSSSPLSHSMLCFLEEQMHNWSMSTQQHDHQFSAPYSNLHDTQD